MTKNNDFWFWMVNEWWPNELKTAVGVWFLSHHMMYLIAEIVMVIKIKCFCFDEILQFLQWKLVLSHVLFRAWYLEFGYFSLVKNVWCSGEVIELVSLDWMETAVWQRPHHWHLNRHSCLLSTQLLIHMRYFNRPLFRNTLRSHRFFFLIGCHIRIHKHIHMGDNMNAWWIECSEWTL